LVNLKIGEHRGRIVKNTGDGFLAEFASVVDAVRCAAEVQRGMAERNVGTPPDKRIEFRVGVNLGDVIAEEHDIFGDGVNVAARLEALAEPGGVCVSRVVRDQVRDKLDFAFEDMGEQQVKNIARPVRVYRVAMERHAEVVTKFVPSPPPDKPFLAPPSFANVRPLSIVILPFLNLSQDAGVEYLVDGIVDSLITDLSCALPGSFVTSRSTAFTYKGRQVSIRQVGQDLGVRYVLEGSVMAEPRRVRVNVQLIDAQTDEHVWAERFDKERKDILEVQDEIVARLSRSVGIEMVRSDAARGSQSGSADALDLVMRARAQANDIKQRENAARAVELFRQALELDPDNVDALAGIAALCTYHVVNLYRLDERDALLDEAEDLISRATALAPDHISVLKARAILLRARGRFADAVIASERVIARNPGEPLFYKEMGLNKLYLGATEEAVEWFRRADAIAPRDPDRWTWLQGLGRALMQLGRDAEAVDALSQAMDSNPGYLRGKAWLAAAEALADDVERARLHLAEFMAIEPEMTVRRFAEERSSVPLKAVSSVYERENERILEGLRKAGMPEE
jgi:TolB-like protein/tetratricopeptide (TPR) repeat protein